MTTASHDQPDDFDAPDEVEQQMISRRLFTYSVHAIKTAATVDRIFVSHPDFKVSLEGCDRIFQLGRELSVQQGLVIVGPTGAGKTALIRNFRRSLPPSKLFEPGLGALAVRLPSRPNVGHLVTAILRQLRYPFPGVSAHNLAIKRQVLIDALRQKGTRLLFVDEAHHLRSQARIRSRVEDGTTVTDCLRELMDEVPLGLALSGSDGLLALDEIDEHLASRVSGRFHLKDFQRGGVWLGLLKAFCRQSTTFDLSVLLDRSEADRLHVATSGSLRGFKRLITEAVLVAVDDHSSTVTAGHLKAAFTRISGSMPPVGDPYAT